MTNIKKYHKSKIKKKITRIGRQKYKRKNKTMKNTTKFTKKRVKRKKISNL